jgi:hypothetical protein
LALQFNLVFADGTEVEPAAAESQLSTAKGVAVPGQRSGGKPCDGPIKLSVECE